MLVSLRAARRREVWVARRGELAVLCRGGLLVALDSEEMILLLSVGW